MPTVHAGHADRRLLPPGRRRPTPGFGFLTPAGHRNHRRHRLSLAPDLEAGPGFGSMRPGDRAIPRIEDRAHPVAALAGRSIEDQSCRTFVTTCETRGALADRWLRRTADRRA